MSLPFYILYILVMIIFKVFFSMVIDLSLRKTIKRFIRLLILRFYKINRDAP